MYVTTLCKRLMANNEHEFLQHMRSRLEWMGKLVPTVLKMGNGKNWNEAITCRTLQRILEYDKENGRTPKTNKDISDFLKHVAKDDKGHPLDGPQIKEVMDELKTLSTLDENDPIYKELNDLDIYTLGKKTFDQARGYIVGNLSEEFRDVALGISSYKVGNKDMTGPDAAFARLRVGMGIWDYSPIARPESGAMDEHPEWVKHHVKRLAGGVGAESYVPLGYWHIDDRVAIDKIDCGFIGIIGEAKAGKTTLLNSIIYNWLNMGKNVLYVSLEHGVGDLSTTFTIMKAMDAAKAKGLSTDRVPSMSTLKLKTREKDELVKNMHEAVLFTVADRIHERKEGYFPGRLDIQHMTLRSWDAIKEHLLMNDAKFKYDCLVVDYFGQLEVPGARTKSDKDAAMDVIIKDAQSLSRTFMGRGLVVMTPIQINREASKGARESEAEKNTERRYTINAIRQDTAYQYALDLCLGVYADDEMKEYEEPDGLLHGKLELEGVFCRSGENPLRHLMFIDKVTRRVIYHPKNQKPAPTAPKWAQTIDDKYESVDDI